MIQGVTIRLATCSDAHDISALIYSQWHHRTSTHTEQPTSEFFAGFAPETIKEHIGSVRYRYWVALMEGQLVGALGIRDRERIMHLFVAESYQRRGIARALWSRTKSELMAEGGEVSVVTNSSIYAVPVYERFGFKAIGPRAERAGVTYVPMQLVISNRQC
jgi:GNAT superfamily N-acetyltransferase